MRFQLSEAWADCDCRLGMMSDMAKILMNHDSATRKRGRERRRKTPIALQMDMTGAGGFGRRNYHRESFVNKKLSMHVSHGMQRKN